MKFDKVGIAFAAIALALFSLSSVHAADSSFGGLYASGASTAQTLSTTAAKVTAFTAAMSESTDDGDQAVDAVAASDHVLLKANGVYEIRFLYTGTADATTKVTFTLRDAGTAITGASTGINHPASTAVSTGIAFIYKPTSDATLTVYAVAASGTPAITPTDMQLVVVRIK